MKAQYICPNVTPLHPDGTPDWESAASLYDALMAAGIDGVLVGGSTGEFFAMSLEARLQAARFAVEHIHGRMTVLVGTGCMIPEDTVQLSNAALDAGADAVAIVPPYYFSLGDDEICALYSRLAREIRGKILVYNYPDRLGYSVRPAALRRLAEEHPNIVGIKDTVNGMAHTREVIKAVRPVRPEFLIYSGLDDSFVHNVLSGGNGCIAAGSNFAPELCAAAARAVNRGDLAAAAEAQRRIDRLVDVYGIGTQFIPYVKEASRQRGFIACARAAFPFPELDAAEQEKVRAFLQKNGLL